MGRTPHGVLKAPPGHADAPGVKCQRVIIEAAGGTFSLDLHERLTVIAGLGWAERESLISELFGALGGTRTGVHLEVIEDTGRHLAVFRPRGGKHRVVDVDHASDVSHEFVGPGGAIDLLGRAGLDQAAARRVLRVRPDDLQSQHGDETVRALAGVDQRLLWSTAERVKTTEGGLSAEAERAGSDPDKAEMVDLIEQRHQRFEAAIAREERTRRNTMVIGGLGAALSMPAAVIQPAMCLPLLAVTLMAVLFSLYTRRCIATASVAEQEALATAGAQSYLGFHLERVNTMLSSAESRRRLVQAADDHRKARDAWRDVAGPVDVEWALAHRDEIVAAALLQRGGNPLGSGEAGFAPIEGELAVNLAHALMAKLSDARRLGPANESLPIVLDDTFAELDKAVKPGLLELLSRSAGSPQVVFLTEDPDVADWARVEALTGEVAIIETAQPAPKSSARPEPAPAPAGPTIDLSQG